jgi:hypothetical protein
MPTRSPAGLANAVKDTPEERHASAAMQQVCHKFDAVSRAITAGVYQWPQGSRETTAIAANSSVR